MPVSALSPRANRHVTGPGRGPAPRRPADPALTVTVAIPLTNDALTPQAHRLIEAVRELVEISQGTITVEPAAPPVPEFPAGPEVRMLTGSRQVVLEGEVLPLTRLEFDLLLFLARHPRQVFSRSQLLSQVWGHTHTTARTVDVHVSRLRTKLDDPDVVTTVYGLGYRLADEAAVTVV